MPGASARNDAHSSPAAGRWRVGFAGRDTPRARPFTAGLAFSPSSDAERATRVDCSTWRPISLIELVSSSAAEAAVCTPAAVPLEAEATALDCCVARSAIRRGWIRRKNCRSA